MHGNHQQCNMRTRFNYCIVWIRVKYITIFPLTIVESSRPGELFCQGMFFVDRLKGFSHVIYLWQRLPTPAIPLNFYIRPNCRKSPAPSCITMPCHFMRSTKFPFPSSSRTTIGKTAVRHHIHMPPSGSSTRSCSAGQKRIAHRRPDLCNDSAGRGWANSSGAPFTESCTKRQPRATRTVLFGAKSTNPTTTQGFPGYLKKANPYPQRAPRICHQRSDLVASTNSYWNMILFTPNTTMEY